MNPAARTYIVVSGPPGSGKSTLAPRIADYFGLPLIAKDTIKDVLMAAAPPADVDASRQLGRMAVAVLYAVAAESFPGAVLESVFYRSRAKSDILSLPGRVVEVFCRCDRNVASARFRARSGTRQAGHLDNERTAHEIWDPEITEPVAGGWPVLDVDTNEHVDLHRLLSELRGTVAQVPYPG
jgi:predicted kinase